MKGRGSLGNHGSCVGPSPLVIVSVWRVSYLYVPIGHNACKSFLDFSLGFSDEVLSRIREVGRWVGAVPEGLFQLVFGPVRAAVNRASLVFIFLEELGSRKVKCLR